MATLSDTLGAAGLGPDTVAARFDNQLVALSDATPSGPGDAAAVSRVEPAGARVHKRSVAFLFACAARRCGRGPAVVGAALGASLECSSGGGAACGDESGALLSAMQAIAKEDRPIVRLVLPRGEVIAYFEATGSSPEDSATLALLLASTATHFAVHVCELDGDGGSEPKGKRAKASGGSGGGGTRCLALDRGPLVPSTGCLDGDHFSLQCTDVGARFPYLLHHAVPEVGGGAAARFELRVTKEPVLAAAYAERRAWCDALGWGCVAAVNASVCGKHGGMKRLVQMSEANHDQQVRAQRGGNDDHEIDDGDDYDDD